MLYRTSLKSVIGLQTVAFTLLLLLKAFIVPTTRTYLPSLPEQFERVSHNSRIARCGGRDLGSKIGLL